MRDGSLGNNHEQDAIFEAAEQAANVEELIVLARDGLAVDHVTYYMAISRGRPFDGPFVRSTYPAQWIARYLLRSYYHIDPVVREGFAATRPFAWHELSPSEHELQVVHDSWAHGLGEMGYSVPVVDRLGRRSLFSVNAGVPIEAWNDFIRIHAAVLEKLAEIAHRKALQELGIVVEAAGPERVMLAPREAECLLWTARGKDAKAIASILDISEYTVRSYLRTGRQKLECRTLSQAVAKALQQGIIDP